MFEERARGSKGKFLQMSENDKLAVQDLFTKVFEAIVGKNFDEVVDEKILYLIDNAPPFPNEDSDQSPCNRDRDEKPSNGKENTASNDSARSFAKSQANENLEVNKKDADSMVEKKGPLNQERYNVFMHGNEFGPRKVSFFAPKICDLDQLTPRELPPMVIMNGNATFSK